MVSNRMTEGVGKKIVEALKNQTDVEITPMNSREVEPKPMAYDEEMQELDFVQDETFEQSSDGNDFFEEEVVNESAEPEMDLHFDIPQFEKPTPMKTQQNNTMSFSQASLNVQETYVSEFEDDELPPNVNVLRQLITKLPSNVSKQTGAQIIKQTMEALGVPMKNVLQDAQQVQENLNNSARDCQNNISEYKRQISLLEKQTHKYQRQYAQLNDIISLFIQTGN